MIKLILQLVMICFFITELHNASAENRVTTIFEDVLVCNGNKDILFRFFYFGSAYNVIITKELAALTLIKFKMDSGSVVKIDDPKEAGVEVGQDTVNNVFTFLLVKNISSIEFFIQGRYSPNHPPYVTSLVINGEEHCQNPDQSYMERFLDAVVKHYEAAPDKFCGRRKINRKYTELIVSGSKTKAGDWPWHAAVMRLVRFALHYTCGGTLISKYTVLTAGHCVTINGIPVNPEMLIVDLGRHTLFSKDSLCTVQEKEVLQVIVHNDFRHKPLKDDIALLTLKTEALYNNYIQPACIWFDGIYDHIGTYEVKGSVVGWGIDNTDRVSYDLKTVTMPQVPHSTCIMRDAVFYSAMLMNGKTFCAGHLNGTSVCNGDSGGGYLVFVQDEPINGGKKLLYDYPPDYKEGAWYVKGIVSVSLARYDASLCDPNSYAVFTDVSKYRNWILNNMK